MTGFVKNIFGQDYPITQYASDFGVLTTLNAPRTYGARVKVTF